MADANAAEQPTAAPSSSDAENQEPSAGEAVGDLLDLSDYLPPLSVSNSGTSGETMTGTERIPPEQQQQQNEHELESPQISPEEGPPPTVDELIAEYGSSRPSSPRSVPASPGDVLEAAAAAPGNDNITTENVVTNGSEGPPADEQPSHPQLNGEKLVPAVENAHSDTIQVASDDNADTDTDTDAEHLEQKDQQDEQQHMPNEDSLLNSSIAPLPQAQDGPAQSETNGTVSNDSTADVGTAHVDTEGAAPEKTVELESAPSNEGDENDDASPMPSQVPESEERIINVISDDKGEEGAIPTVDGNGCDAPVANEESASVPVIGAEETHRIEPSTEEDGKNGDEIDEGIDGNTCDAADDGNRSVPAPAMENGEDHADDAEEVEVLGQCANTCQDEKTAQEQEEVPSTSSEAPALENEAAPQKAGQEENARDEDKSIDEAPVGFTLTFADYVDLQSRLVLVPLDDGECLGAKIANFGLPAQEQPQQHSEDSQGNDQVDASDTMEDIELDTGSSEEKKGEDADDKLQSGANNETENTLKSHSSPPIEPEVVVGSVLVKIPGLVDDNGEEDDDDWTQVDFTYILSAIRDVEVPISLHFRRADDEGTTDGNDAEIRISESNSRSIPNEQSGVVAAGEIDSAAVSTGTMSTRLSRWGSRASQLAIEAKEKALIAMEEAERQLEKKGITDRLASVTSSKIDGGQSNEPTAEETEGDAYEELTPSPRSWEEAGLDQPPCGLYLQKASGTFAQLDISPDIADAPQVPQISELSLSNAVPLRPTLSSSSVSSRSSIAGLSWRKKLFRLHPVTNTSVLLVRAAAESPCPAKGYEYQWYRSCKRNADDTSSVSYTSSHSGANDASSLESVDGWFALDGATYAAFQPSATDIGHRIRCVVTIQSTAGMTGAGNDKPINDGPIQVMCELPFPVVADPSLFSAARQGFAAPNGGIFANLKGRGNASGRSFRLQIMPSEEGSRMRMFQTSGSTAELLHDVKEPIVFASATAMPAEPKVFDLYFPSGLPESAEMVRALCNDEGHFKLKAPNRIARESLLLSLGIANFCAFGGKPVDMNASSTLFPDTPHGAVIEYDCLKQNSTKEGDTATSPHAVREVKVVSPVQEERAEDTSSVDPLPLPSLASNDDKPVASEAKTRAWMSPMLTLSPKTPGTETTTEADARFQALEAELRSKIDTIFAKEKACSDLQRRIAAAESGKRRSDDQVKHLKSESEMYKRRHTECSRTLRSAEKKIEMNDNAMARMRQEYEARIASLEDRLKKNANISSEQAKSITTLSNEKAVLEAAVEARDGKLSAMDLLQDTVSDLRKQVADNESAKNNLGRCKAELEEMTTRFNDAQKKLETTTQLKAQLQESQENAKKEQKAAERCKAQMESANVRCQKLKVELRSAKQKVESLSKDLSRAHATTRSASKDAERAKKMKLIQQECEDLKKEVSFLTSEKRRITEERDESRRLHEQSIKSQVEAGIDEKVVRALERYDELERVVSELTEYIEAKEMQLETMMEVNKALQDEIASMRK